MAKPTSEVAWNVLWEGTEEETRKYCTGPESEINENFVVNELKGQQMITRCNTLGFIQNVISIRNNGKQTGFTYVETIDDYEKNLHIFQDMLNSVSWE